MSKDFSLHEEMTMPTPYLGVKLGRYTSHKYGSVIFDNHWHEHIEILYFKSGSMLIELNSNPINVKAGELIIINSNDLHRGTNLSDNLYYYCIIMDTSFLCSKTIDICDTKYITPIAENYIVFKNRIVGDEALCTCIDAFIKEYEEKEVGFELALKSCLYHLFTLLLRNHSAYTITPSQYNIRLKKLQIFNPILQYIERHFNESLTVDMFSKMSNMSKSYFCYSFKEFTKRTFSEYLNLIRINKSEYMLKNSDMNVSQVAMACGFNDINYFSRIYKKYKNVSPSFVISSAKNLSEISIRQDN